MVSRNIQADILDVLSDGKLHTLNEIAEKVEVCKMTVYRHIQALTYRHNIETFHGGDKKGGVRLITDNKVSIEGLDSNDLQHIINALESLQDSSMAVKVFAKRLQLQLEIKEKL